MRIPLQLHLPPLPHAAVLASLTVAVGPDRSVVVGYRLEDIVTEELIALEALAPCTWEDLPSVAEEVLGALCEAVEMLLDFDPF